MIEGLERFVGELRRRGVAASPAEWLDALAALELVGLTDRERFRQALRSSLAKRVGQRAVFDRVFDRFFVSPARRAADPGGDGDASMQRAGSRREIRLDGSAGRPGAPGQDDSPLDERPRPRAIDPLLERVRLGDPSRRGRLRRVITDAERSTTGRKERGGQTSRPDGTSESPLRRSLSRRMTTEDEREIAEQVPRLIERIRLRSGRRLRRAARGRLYPRGVFRENLARGGVPFVLPRRRVKPRRNRIVLLVDVSWSTARAAGLFLCIAAEFLRRAGSARVVFFVDRAVDATRDVDLWLACSGTVGQSERPAPRRRRLPGSGIVRGDVDFARVLQGLRRLNLDAPSDYGRAFHDLLRSTSRPLGRDTILLVLGDGRTNRFDPQAWAFEEIVERCGVALWIVPEPLERWGTGDSALAEYLVHVDAAVEARDLVGLARGVGELLRRI